MSVETVPAGWEICKLDEVASLIRGVTFPTNAKRHQPVDGYVACLRTANVQTEVEWDDLWYIPREYIKHAEQYVQPGDVLISTANSFELVGKVARIKASHPESSLGAFISALRSERGIEQAYFYYLMSAEQTQRHIRSLASTTTNISNVSGAKLKELNLPIAPAAEQIRIVEKLEELLSDLDAGVAELKAAQRKLAQYRQSLLKAAVEGALTADWRATHAAAPSSSSLRKQGPSDSKRNPAKPLDFRVRGNDGHEESGADLLQRILTERRARWEQKQLVKFASQGKTPPQGWQSKYSDPVSPDTTDLPSLPEGWTWATVDQLSLVQKYGSSAKTNEDCTGVPVLRMGNIQEGELELGKLKYLPRSHHEFPDLFLDDGDLLFNRTNSPELVGKTAVFRSRIVPCSYASYLIVVRVSPRCSPDFVSAYINSTYGRQWVKSVVTQQVGQANVNGSKLAALAVPLPSEREQSEITRCLVEQRQGGFEQETMVARGIRQAAAQRKNILKAAFAGQLVPQDPNDEPASMLLERIRAERDNPKHPSTRSRRTKPPKRYVESDA